MWGFARVAEEEGLLPERVPLCVHGAFSNYDDDQGIGVGDYLCFLNVPGAAVISKGWLVGVHVAA